MESGVGRYRQGMVAPRIEVNADVDSRAEVSDGCVVWQLVQIREDAVIGAGCVIGRGAYIGPGVRIGNHVKVQNNALIYEPAVIGNFAFVGPGAVLTNDRYPRSTDPEGRLKGTSDWHSDGVVLGDGASVGAQAVVLGGVVIGVWACVGAGAVVTHDVPDYALVVGNPARQVGWVGRSGRRLVESEGEWTCPETGQRYRSVGNGLEFIDPGSEHR